MTLLAAWGLPGRAAADWSPVVCLARVCYERATFSPTIQTFILSAIWHGVYPGYYLTFLTGVLMTLAARAVSTNHLSSLISSNSIFVQGNGSVLSLRAALGSCCSLAVRSGFWARRAMRGVTAMRSWGVEAARVHTASLQRVFCESLPLLQLLVSVSARLSRMLLSQILLRASLMMTSLKSAIYRACPLPLLCPALGEDAN